MPPVRIDENIQFIITKLKSGTDYVIPVLNEFHKAPQQKHDRYRKKQRHCSQGLKKLAKIAGIQSNLTPYVEHHTMTKILIEKGVSILQVQAVCNH